MIESINNIHNLKFSNADWKIELQWILSNWIVWKYAEMNKLWIWNLWPKTKQNLNDSGFKHFVLFQWNLSFHSVFFSPHFCFELIIGNPETANATRWNRIERKTYLFRLLLAYLWGHENKSLAHIKSRFHYWVFKQFFPSFSFVQSPGSQFFLWRYLLWLQ